MLLDELTDYWSNAARIPLQIRDLTPEDQADALALMQRLFQSTREDAAEAFARAAPAVQEALLWMLLSDALRTDAAEGQAARLLDWVEFLSESSRSERWALQQGHGRYLRGCAIYADGGRSGARDAFSGAVEAYQTAEAPVLLRAVAGVAQGLITLESDGVDAEGRASGAARRLFHEALEALRDSGVYGLAEQLETSVLKVLDQREWAETLIAAPEIPRLRERDGELVDRQLFRFLHVCIQQTAGVAPIEQVVDAARLVEAVARQVGEPAEIRRELAGWYLHSRQAVRAEFVVRELLREEPEDADLRQMLVHLLALEKKHAELLATARPLLEQNPDDPALLMMVGMALFHLRELHGAYDCLTRSLALDASDPFPGEVARAILPAVAYVYENGKLRERPEATLLTDEERRAGKRAALLAAHPDTLEERLRVLFVTEPELGEQVLRLLELQGVVEAPEPDPARRHLDEAEAHFGQGRWEEAEAAYQAAIHADPHLAPAYMGLGDVHYRGGKFYLARAYFEESIAIEPSASTYRFLGDTHRHLGKLERALECYRKALELKPDYSGARIALEQVTELLQEAPPDVREGPGGTGPGEETLDEFVAEREDRTPLSADALAASVSDQYPIVGQLLAAPTLQLRLEMVRRELQPEQYDALLLTLTALGFQFAHKAGEVGRAIDLAELRYHIALLLPADWDPEQGMGLSPARHRADALAELAQFHEDEGFHARALECAEEAEREYLADEAERKRRGLTQPSKFDQLFVRRNLRAALAEQLARLYAATGKPEQAAECRQRAWELDQVTVTPETRLVSHFRISSYAQQQGDMEAALRFFRMALDEALADRVSRISSHHVAIACQALGDTHQMLGLAHGARHFLERALELNAATGHRERLYNAHAALARLFTDRPDLGEAQEHRAQALRYGPDPLAEPAAPRGN